MTSLLRLVEFNILLDLTITSLTGTREFHNSIGTIELFSPPPVRVPSRTTTTFGDAQVATTGVRTAVRAVYCAIGGSYGDREQERFSHKKGTTQD